MQVELSEKTKELVHKIFPSSARQQVENILMNECGSNLPFQEGSNSVVLERFRFAVLKLSNGTVVEMERQIQIAKTDLRDLLVAAGFENNVEEHQKWFDDFCEKQC